LRVWLPIVLLAIHVMVFNALASRAFHYRIDPDEPRWGYQIWYSRFFTEEGLRRRRVALSYLFLGGLVVAVVSWFL
jgi:hypothetical protein